MISFPAYKILVNFVKTSYLYLDQLIAQYHPMLQRIAFRILKSKADAEDILQETYIKLLNIDLEKIQNLKAYLIATVVNNCLHHLEVLRRKKEEYLEELNVHELIGKISDMEFFQFDLQEELKEAFAVLQSKLEPLERAVYLLKEVFDYDYDSLQELLDKRKDHCRQLFSRARKKLFEETEKINFNLPNKTELFNSFKTACDFSNPSEFILQLKADITCAMKKSF